MIVIIIKKFHKPLVTIFGLRHRKKKCLTTYSWSWAFFLSFSFVIFTFFIFTCLHFIMTLSRAYKNVGICFAWTSANAKPLFHSKSFIKLFNFFDRIGFHSNIRLPSWLFSIFLEEFKSFKKVWKLFTTSFYNWCEVINPHEINYSYPLPLKCIIHKTKYFIVNGSLIYINILKELIYIKELCSSIRY